jgi:hypothetical protein
VSKIKRKVILILSILLIGMMLAGPSPVTAQTSENLDWGIEVGDITNFSFYYWAEESDITLNENMYINITGPMGVIPDPLINYSDIPDTPAEALWVNGTDMGFMLMIIIYVWKIAIPTGNWSLMTALVENVTEFTIIETIFPVEPHVIIDNWYQWGYTFNVSISGIENVENVANVTYLKSDGSFAAMHLVGYVEGTSTLIGEASMYRDGTPPAVNTPANIVYDVGATGNEIIWNATDLSPAAYRILKDDVEIKQGLWNSSSDAVVAHLT